MNIETAAIKNNNFFILFSLLPVSLLRSSVCEATLWRNRIELQSFINLKGL